MSKFMKFFSYPFSNIQKKSIFLSVNIFVSIKTKRFFSSALQSQEEKKNEHKNASITYSFLCAILEMRRNLFQKPSDVTFFLVIFTFFFFSFLVSILAFIWFFVVVSLLSRFSLALGKIVLKFMDEFIFIVLSPITL